MRTNAIMNCPTINPSTICKYAKQFVLTIPGTETNVTPDMAEPTIAKATTYHLDFRLPTKKPSLSALRPATYEMVNSTMKYAKIVIITVIGLILYLKHSKDSIMF